MFINIAVFGHRTSYRFLCHQFVVTKAWRVEHTLKIELRDASELSLTDTLKEQLKALERDVEGGVAWLARLVEYNTDDVRVTLHQAA